MRIRYSLYHKKYAINYSQNLLIGVIVYSSHGMRIHDIIFRKLLWKNNTFQHKTLVVVQLKQL